MKKNTELSNLNSQEKVLNKSIDLLNKELKEKKNQYDLEVNKLEKIINQKKQFYVNNCKKSRDLIRIDWNLVFEKPIKVKLRTPKNNFFQEEFLETEIILTKNTGSPFSAGGGKTYFFLDVKDFEKNINKLETKELIYFPLGLEERIIYSKDRKRITKLSFKLAFVYLNESGIGTNKEVFILEENDVSILN